MKAKTHDSGKRSHLLAFSWVVGALYLVGCAAALDEEGEVGNDVGDCGACDSLSDYDGELRRIPAEQLLIAECAVHQVTGQEAYEIRCDIPDVPAIVDPNDDTLVTPVEVMIKAVDATGEKDVVFWDKEDDDEATTLVLEVSSFPVDVTARWDDAPWTGNGNHTLAITHSIDSPDAAPLRFVQPFDIWEVVVESWTVKPYEWDNGTRLSYRFDLPDNVTQESCGEGGCGQYPYMSTRLSHRFGEKRLLLVPPGTEAINVTGTGDTGLRKYDISLDIVGPGVYSLPKW